MNIRYNHETGHMIFEDCLDFQSRNVSTQHLLHIAFNRVKAQLNKSFDCLVCNDDYTPPPPLTQTFVETKRI